MSTERILIHGDTASRMAVTPALGQVGSDDTTGQVILGDGATAGGIPMARDDKKNIGSLGYLAAVKTDDYTVLAADVGKILVADKATAIEFLLTAPATLGDKFVAIIKNEGVGALTIDPDAAEIDGEASLVLAQGAAVVLSCDGSNFRTVLKQEATAINSLAAKTTPVDADEFQLADSAASFGSKKLSFANLKVWVLALIGAQVVTPWVAYTPTLVGFGTPTGVTFYSRRCGPNLEIFARFAVGTSTTTEVRIPLGFNGTEANVAVSSFMNSSVYFVGMAALSITAAAQYIILATGGNTYLRVGIQNSGRAGLTAVNGDTALPSSGSALSFTASVPIEGWS